MLNFVSKILENIKDDSKICFDDIELYPTKYTIKSFDDEGIIVFSNQSESIIINLKAVKQIRFAHTASILDFFMEQS